MNNQSNNDYDKDLSWSENPDDTPFANKEEQDDDEKQGTFTKLIKTTTMVVLAFALLVFVGVAWFTMNANIGTRGMGVRAETDNYTISLPAGGVNGKYYDAIHSKIQQGEEEEILVWTVTSDSHFNNIDAGSGTNYDGIEPGSSGVISFLVTPKVDEVTITFDFQTFGYIVVNSESGSSPSGTVDYTVREIDNNRLKDYLNGHLLLFENYSENTQKYSGLIPANDEMKREFTRTFTGKGVATQVDIYWIWPKNLSNLVYVEDGSGTQPTIVEHPEHPSSGSEYQKLVNHITTFPSFFLQGNWSSGDVSEQMIQNNYTTYGGYYDGADNDIGSGIEYVLLRMWTVN